ncbi:CaiB/BaiF CoA transferase family protein [Lacrimispora sp.]|uniref:CaiB/BaiF CoA transferase family protein n=1 Tax=Lacrimispora sp. TaxID=2719234 RepID=UPI0028B09C43|nr:CoA transferase [Lacrimispora sp.]
MNTALEGIKVVELSHVISGSYCGMLLGDMGASVIKIERPGSGEFYRDEALKNEEGVSLVYPSYNRNKRGITLNIKDPKAKEILHKLIKDCDVFIENYRPGLLKKMGLGYDDLKKVNPKLIMVSISGFGQNGPYAMKPAYDMTIAAVSGFMSVNGPEGIPMKSGPAISDFLSGIYGAVGAMAALRNCERTGEGQYVDISMMECSMSILDAFFAQERLSEIKPLSMGNRRANYAPVNSFQVKDGHVYIAASLQKHWDALTRLMDRKDLYEDPRYDTASNRKKYEEELEEIVQTWAIQYDSKRLIALLDENGIPCSPVQTLSQVMNDPHVAARNSIIEFEYPGVGNYPVVAFTPKFSTMVVPVKRAPLLGEHNKEVYVNRLGYTETEYQEMQKKHTI